MRFKRTSSKGAAEAPAVSDGGRDPDPDPDPAATAAAEGTTYPEKPEKSKVSSVADGGIAENNAAAPPQGERPGASGAAAASTGNRGATEAPSPAETAVDDGREEKEKEKEKETKAGFFGFRGSGVGKGGGTKDDDSAAAAKAVGDEGSSSGDDGHGDAELSTKTLPSTPLARREEASEGIEGDDGGEGGTERAAAVAEAHRGDTRRSRQRSEDDGAGSSPVGEARGASAATAVEPGAVHGAPHESACDAGERSARRRAMRDCGNADDDNDSFARCLGSSGSGSVEGDHGGGYDSGQPAASGGEERGGAATKEAGPSTTVRTGTAAAATEIGQVLLEGVDGDVDSRGNGGDGGATFDATAFAPEIAGRAAATPGGAVAVTKERPSDDAEAAVEATQPDARNSVSAAADATGAGRTNTPPSHPAKASSTPAMTMTIDEAAAVVEAEGRAVEQAYADALNAAARVQETPPKTQADTHAQVPPVPGGVHTAGSDKSGGAAEASAATATGGSITIYGSEDHLYEGDCLVVDEGGLWRQLQTPHMMFIQCQLGVLGVLVMMILVCWRRHGGRISVLYAPPADVATPCQGVNTP